MPEIPLPQLGPTQPDAHGCGNDPDASSLLLPDEDRDADASTNPGPSVYLETFGCQMNVLDSQLVVSQLRALGYHFTGDWKTADIVLYNTCSIREQAENKVWSRVGIVGKHKKENPGMVLGVIGCMAERDGKSMVRRYPQIDLLCGPGELDKIPMLIDNVFKTKIDVRAHANTAQVALQGNTHRRSSTLSAASDKLELIDLSRSFNAADTELPGEHIPGAGKSAYVRITRGCNKLCTYCVVPNTRGAEVHRHPDHIVEECKKLADQGVIEVTLLGQTVNHYHYDRAAAIKADGIWQPQVGTVISPNKGTGGPSPTFNDTTTSFADLLWRIHEEVPAIARLRFVTSLPRDFGDDILQVMRDAKRICRYLHLPVQSGSNRILAKMNRGYRVEQYKDLLDRVRHYLPTATLATDIIVGFPGETDDDFEKTADLMRFGKFKNSFIFKYSPRPGTVAYDRIPDSIPDQVKRQRNNALLALQTELSKAVHASFVGQTVSVFVEGVSQKIRKAEGRGQRASDAATITQLSGRTDGDLITLFNGDPSLIGQIVEVRVESSAPLSLSGALV